MPVCSHCGGSIPADGFLPLGRAAALAGRSLSWVKARIHDGRLHMFDVGGVHCVIRAEIRALAGCSPPSLIERAQMLDEQGREMEAVALRRQAQDDWNRDNSIALTPPEAQPDNSAVDPGKAFLARFFGG